MPAQASATSSSSSSKPACPHCRGRGWRVVADGGAGTARPCECRQQELGAHLLAAAGIPPRYERCRLSRFNTTSDNPRITNILLKARKLSERYVDEFFNPQENRFRSAGLLYIGPPGVGKTHLATAVLTDLILRYNVHGLFIDFTELLQRIQATFDPQTPETQDRILRPLTSAEILVVDELGSRTPSNWLMDTLYLIMNTRYTRLLPTIFTTNYALPPDPDQVKPQAREAAAPAGEELLSARISERLLSRLYEMTQPVRLTLGNWDYRAKVKRHAHRLDV